MATRDIFANGTATIHRIIGAILAAVFLAVCTPTVCAQELANISPMLGMINELEDDPKAKVQEELKNRIPDMFSDGDNKEYAEWLIGEIDVFGEHGQAIYKGDYSSIKSEMMDRLVDKFENQVTTRFDEGSPIRRMMDQVKDRPDVAKKLARAALNADSDAAFATMREELKKFADDKREALVGEGIDIWKNLACDVVPGCDRAKTAGYDPIGIYLQGVSNAADLAERARTNFNDTMLDCYGWRYGHLLKNNEGDTPRALLMREGPQGKGGFCGQAAKAREAYVPRDNQESTIDSIALWPGRAWRSMKDTIWGKATDTAALGTVDFSRADIIKLIQTFVEENQLEGRDPLDWPKFSDWLKDRMVSSVTERTKSVQDEWEAAQKKFAEEQQKKIKNVIDGLKTVLPEIIRQVSGDQGLKKVAKVEEGKFKPVKKTLEEQIEDDLKTEECKLRGPKKDTQPKVDKDGFIAQETFKESRPSSGCEPYGKAAESRDDGIKTQEAGDTTIYQYIVPIKRQLCDDYQGLLRVGRAHLDRGEVDRATAQFETARLMNEAQSEQWACPAVQTALEKEIENATRLTRILTGIEGALTACEPKALSKWSKGIGAHNAKRAKRGDEPNLKLAALKNRIDRSLPVARAYDSGKSHYLGGNPVTAEVEFRKAQALVMRASLSDQETCTGIGERLANNKGRAEALIKEEQRITEAASRCDMPALETAKDAYAGLSLKFMGQLTRQIDAALPVCLKQARNEQCHKEYGGGYRVGLVVEDGFYCVPDKATASAECVKSNGSGYYASSVNGKGEYGCLPTKSTANRKCRQINQGRGSGIYAGKIQADGSFDCYQKARRAAPRSQPQRRATTRRRPPPQVQRRQPAYDPRAAAAAAAIAGTIIQGIIESQGSGGGGGGGCSNPLAAGC